MILPLIKHELFKKSLLNPPIIGCVFSVRNLQQRPVTPLPRVSSKGTRMTRYVVPPAKIGQIKSWDSRHTGGLKGSLWPAERFHDDVMICKFIEGVFYENMTSEPIIKRRLNKIIICFFVSGKVGRHGVHSIYFMKAFSEKVLEEMLGCIIKIELRTGPERLVKKFNQNK